MKKQGRDGMSQRALVLWYAVIEAMVLIPLVLYLACRK
jgi:hypothetical protein